MCSVFQGSVAIDRKKKEYKRMHLILLASMFQNSQTFIDQNSIKTWVFSSMKSQLFSFEAHMPRKIVCVFSLSAAIVPQNTVNNKISICIIMVLLKVLNHNKVWSLNLKMTRFSWNTKYNTYFYTNFQFDTIHWNVYHSPCCTH